MRILLIAFVFFDFRSGIFGAASDNYHLCKLYRVSRVVIIGGFGGLFGMDLTDGISGIVYKNLIIINIDSIFKEIVLLQIPFFASISIKNGFSIFIKSIFF